MIRKFFAALVLAMLVTLTQNAQAYEHFEYSGYVEDYGWLGPVGDGEIIGTVGEHKALEALIINFRGGIRYCAHVQNIGWQDWTTSGGMAGTVDQGLHMEAIRIQLVGRSEEYWDVYYRAHVKNLGWLGWAKNGEPAGTEGASLRMEALQIKLVDKGERFHRGNQPSFYSK